MFLDIGDAVGVAICAVVVADLGQGLRTDALPVGDLVCDTLCLRFGIGGLKCRFFLGSTVILLFPPGVAAWNDDLVAGAAVRLARP